jgi:hypothetical protein
VTSPSEDVGNDKRRTGGGNNGANIFLTSDIDPAR